MKPKKAVIVTAVRRLARWRQRAGLWLLLCLGLYLRLYTIDSRPIWLDEAFSLWMASHPLPTLVDWAVRIDQHPPAYYILLRGWMAALGDGPAAVRLFSALCSVATLPLFYRLALRLTADGRIAGVALLVLTLSPFHIQYAQEVRMYALLTLLVTVTVYLAWTVWQETEAKGRRLALAAGLALCQAGAMLTHNVAAVFLPLLLNLAAWGLWRRTPGFPARLWGGTQAAAFLLWLPWAGPFLVQAQGVDRRFWLQPPTLADLMDALHTWTFAFLPAEFPLGWPGLGLFAVLAVLGALRCRPAVRWLLLGWLLLPIAGLLLVSLRRPLFHPPSLLPLSLPYYLLLAGGFFTAWPRPGGWRLWLSLLVLMNGVAFHSYATAYEKEAWDEAAFYVAARVAPGDLLLFNASWVQLPFDYYFAADTEVEKHGLPVDLFAGGELEPAMTAADVPRLRRLSAGHGRIWLIYSHHWYTDPERLIPTTLAQDRALVVEESFYGIDIYRFE